MKYIFMGIKDYCKDCWHDWLLVRFVNTYDNEKIEEDWTWKEGNLWHYIKQRKFSYKTQNTREWVLEEYIKTKQDFIYYVWAALDEIASNGATYEWFVDECNYLCKIAKKRGWLQ